MLKSPLIRNACLAMLVTFNCLCATNSAIAVQSSDVLAVFSDSTATAAGEFSFTSTTEIDLSGSSWGFGVNENDVYHAALTHFQPDGPANQSFMRPYNDEVFQAISVDTTTRATGGQAAFYHQSGYYVDRSNVFRPTFAPLLASRSVEPNSWSTLSLAVQADTESNPQQPGGLLNYQRTRDLGDGVIEVTHSIYNFGTSRVNFHNLPWGGVRKTVFDNMLVSNPNGGFTDRQIVAFDDTANQVITAANTGGWAAFTEGTAGTDRGVAYVFGDTDTHLSESWQTFESSWRWGDAGGDFFGIPIRNFNVGTFRRQVDIDPGDLFESRYFLVLGDVNRIESTIVDRAFALPVNGSQPLFLFEDAAGSCFVSVDPYALSDTPYDGETDYKGILGFVLPSEIASADGNYVALQTVFAGNDNYLSTDPGTTFFALPGVPEPAAGTILGDVNQDRVVDFGFSRKRMPIKTVLWTFRTSSRLLQSSPEAS